ncbi:MATE family efflux transporter [Lactonifactor longoviformis]|uniref:Multidrug export protein MepA n=1 Tax=Lactonifactor longoviformis DSM 17459 TaxID=1122155 RepID=A0A1M5BJF4_9CLOT|nr:MATE family efflux transporter [Lactonifactor longoviformis]POP31914.1 MATE family efflux transporter [Lactonifactor longoviformis]SHF42713.1 putative efflux protein, MATE family [Lactonifactor longoviformis DSM 17459]
MKSVTQEADNPLGYQKESKLLINFAVPCIISMLVTALYNIVDQIFIGQGVGMLGNAATNIAFPLSTTCTAIALLLGIGGASNFSLELGAEEEKRAARSAGNAMVLMAIFGLTLFVLVTIFLTPMLKFFGATSDVLPYAQTYTRITSIGFPFLIANTAISKLILADGSPKYSMMSMLVGAVINTILDPIFIFGLDMGMAGAALATIIGQIISFCISLRYVFHFRHVKLTRESFHLSQFCCRHIFALGASACFNQIAMTIVQIVMNNTLSYYGAQSVYGGEIPLACAGIITKVNMVFMAIIIGISQGTQPIVGFNYGARKYGRVKKTYLQAVCTATVLSFLAFLCFQIFPRQIISIFGEGSEMYYTFSERYFRIFMFLVIVNGIQPVTSNFFTSIGKSRLGIFMSLTRQIIFLLPLIIIFPLFMGIDGVMYAGPIADAAAAIVCGVFLVRELKELTQKQNQTLAGEAL